MSDDTDDFRDAIEEVTALLEELDISIRERPIEPGTTHTTIDISAERILLNTEKNFEQRPDAELRLTHNEVASGTSSLVPASERQINIWIGNGDEGLKQALNIGQAYIINFMVGQPKADSLIFGPTAEVNRNDVPRGGLPTEWFVIARDAELVSETADTEVSVANVGGATTWTGRFKVLIPEEGDSSKVQLFIRPLKASPSIDIVINACRDDGFPQFNEFYRQFKIQLATISSPGRAGLEPARIVDEQMPTATAHVGLGPTHEWATPQETLNINVIGSHAAVKGIAGREQIDSIEAWEGVPAQVAGTIKSVRGAAEATRAFGEKYFNDIDPNDLADRLENWAKHRGGPEYDWSSLGSYSDPTHTDEWDKMAVSVELRMLAHHGRQLFRRFFPIGSNLAKWISALVPGARLNVSWTPKSGPGYIPHVPWGLMYVDDLPPDGQPVDPMGFLGLRCRIAYTSHVTAPASRALGALDATHRAHFLYWGDSPRDVTGQEAQRQRTQWGGWKNHTFVPQTQQDGRAQILRMLNHPQPSPTSVLYLFCQCNTGEGNNPILRFGGTNDPANIIAQSDFGTALLADRPLVFANACTTAAADPYMANELEQTFFERNCRAFIGTETKVPIVLASRLAEIFFQFFYRVLDKSPMAAGEALAQARLFLWTHYRNIGGLFYCCVNQYDLFFAHENEVLALRG